LPQTAEVLSRLVRILAEAQALAEKRASLVVLVEELEEAHAESIWLKEYEQDPNRYKARRFSMLRLTTGLAQHVPFAFCSYEQRNKTMFLVNQLSSYDCRCPLL
jgi:hypothetical protein